MFDDVIVAAILLTLCVVVIGVIGVTCRLLAVYRATGGGRWNSRRDGSPPPPPPQQHLRLLASGEEENECIRLQHQSIKSPSSSGPKVKWRREEKEKEREGQEEVVEVEVSPQGGGRGQEEEEEGGGSIPPPTTQPPFHADPVVEKTVETQLVTMGPGGAGGGGGGGCEEGIAIGDDVISARNLQRALSCDSVMSDTSSADTTEYVTHHSAAKIGQLEFGLHYDSELSDLVVNILQAKDLEKNTCTDSQDSFVKLWVTPHEDRKQQTKIQKDSLNPQYSERFRFRLAPDRLDSTRVQFQVYSCDRYARQRLIGETEIRLGDVDVRQPVRVWMNLHEMDQKPMDFGDVMFSLAYLPTAERLTVVIAKARNLVCPVGRLSAGCFAKVHLLQKGKKVAKKKTSLKNEERNPIFNEAMTFMLPAATLLTVELRISILVTTPDKTGQIVSVGHVTIGPRSTGMELVHWNQTMTSLRKPVTMWHSLRRD